MVIKGQFQDEPWCCKYCTDYRDSDIKPDKDQQEYLEKAHTFNNSSHSAAISGGLYFTGVHIIYIM